MNNIDKLYKTYIWTSTYSVRPIFWALKLAIVDSFKFICTHSMPAVMILLWSLDVIVQCAVWTIALVCTTSFPELDLYKFSLAMGKPIIHLTCFAGPTVAFPKFSVFYETRKTSWHSSHCLFEFIFISLSRVTIVFSYCPQIAKASLQYRPWALQHYTRVSCMRKTLVKHSCKNIHAKIHEKIHAN